MKSSFFTAIAGLMVAVAILVGCDARSVVIEVNPANMTYTRDARTDMCFASLGRASGSSFSDIAESFSMTYVPCTPAVLALVPVSQGGQLK